MGAEPQEETPPTTTQDCPDTVHGCYYDDEEKLFQAVYESPDKPIIDVDEYVKCFNTNTSAKVTLYSDQPNPGTRDAYNGTDVGHAFFSIEQSINGDIIRRTMGFYPDEDKVNPITDRSSPSAFGNDDNRGYNIRYEQDVSGAQLSSVLNIVSNASGIYHLNNNNCTHCYWHSKCDRSECANNGGKMAGRWRAESR